MLIYLHIPKTAGTSFRGWMKSALHGKTIYWHGESGLIQKEAIESLKSVDVIGGHFPGNIKIISQLENLLGIENICYLSIVREPLEQVFSHFRFVSERPSNSLYTPLSINEALQGDTRFYDVQKNLQCSYFSPSRTYSEALSWMKQRNCIVGDFKHLNAFCREIEMSYSLPHFELTHINRSRIKTSQKDKPDIIYKYVEQFCEEDKELYNFISSQKIFVNKI